jgi:hypothetical protein
VNRGFLLTTETLRGRYRPQCNACIDRINGVGGTLCFTCLEDLAWMAYNVAEGGVWHFFALE